MQLLKNTECTQTYRYTDEPFTVGISTSSSGFLSRV